HGRVPRPGLVPRPWQRRAHERALADARRDLRLRTHPRQGEALGRLVAPRRGAHRETTARQDDRRQRGRGQHLGDERLAHADDPNDGRRDADSARLDADADPRLQLARPGPEQPALPRPADAGRGEDLARAGPGRPAGAAEAYFQVSRLVIVAAATSVLLITVAGCCLAATPI